MQDVATALARIDRALARSELTLAGPRVSAVPTRKGEGDARYLAMRSRTQAALSELDTVIARIAKAEQG